MKYTQHMLPRNYWKDEQNQRIYFNFLKEQLGGTYECLYHVESRHVAQSGGMNFEFDFSNASRTPSLTTTSVT